MCGIAGILLRDGLPDPGSLARMLDAQRHRGPDGRGTHLDGPLALGAVRLAVLDRTEAARQPLRTPDGRFTLAYNGEVYNYRELRSGMERLGDAFRSTGDAEVVLKALARWGEGALPRLDGVFALALWDAAERRLLLARDRLGVRPLYWAESSGALRFASEIKGILAAGGLRPALDGPALAELFRFQNVWSERTLFEGILPVPAGGILAFRGGRREERRWWRLAFPGDARLSLDEAAEALKPLLSAAVRRQLASDVPVGSALSGGLDGAALAAEASASIPALHTFTVGFQTGGKALPGERGVDERPAARDVARLLGTRHHETGLSPAAALEALPDLVRHLEEPRLAASFQNLEAARLARRHVTVVLSGGGGDELFGGYPWRYARVLGANEPGDFAEGFSAAWSRVLEPGREASFWTDEGLRLVRQGDPEGVLRRLAAEAGDVPPLHRAMTVEARTFLPAHCVLEDKLHMAVGAEVRVPFLDHGLMDWAVRLPESLRLSDGGRTGKPVLRRALAGRLPGAVLAAPKQGFVPPLMTWAGRAPWEPFLREALLGGPFRERGLIRSEAVEADLQALREGRIEPLQRVWTCLAFETWCRVFLDGNGVDAYGASGK